MTTLIMQATPFVEMVAPKVQAIYLQFLQAFDRSPRRRCEGSANEAVA